MVGFTQLPLADTLLGDGIDVARVPDLDAGLLVVFVLLVAVLGFRAAIGRVFRGFLARLGRRDALLDAEEHDRAVIGPRRRPVFGDAGGAGHLGMGAAVERVARRRRTVEPAPYERHVGGVRESLVLDGPEHREVGRVFPPTHLAVGGLGLIERPQGAGLGVVERDTVTDPVVGIDGHREQVSIVGPARVRHVAEHDAGAGREFLDDQIRSLALLVVRLVPAKRDEAPVGGQAERLDAFAHIDRARRQVEDGGVVPNGPVGPPRRRALLFRPADPVDQPAAVAAEGLPRSVGSDDHRVDVRAVDAQLVLVVHASDGCREPAPIGRELCTAELFPPAVVVRSERGPVLRREGGGGGDEGQEGSEAGRSESRYGRSHYSLSRGARISGQTGTMGVEGTLPPPPSGAGGASGVCLRSFAPFKADARASQRTCGNR